MKWIGNRISFHEDKQRSTFVIYPEKKAWVTGLMGAWCAMWLAIGAVMTWAAFALELTDTERIITVVFLGFWFYYAQRVGRSFLWMMYGKEMLKINEASLSVKRSIKKYGKANQYFHENIQKIKMTVPTENSFQAAWESSPWVTGGERIEFQYMGKTVRFGRKLSEKEAKMLFQMITRRVDEQLRRAKKASEI